MTQIKICGFTDPKEAAFVSYPDVSYMGMVLFFEKSKRNISLKTAKAILRAADPRIQKVAVVVSPSPAQAEEIEKAGFDYMQVHGVLGAEVLSMTRLPIIRAYNGKAEEEEDPRICAHLFDAAEPGSGQAFDWKMLAEKKRKKPWFLAFLFREHLPVKGLPAARLCRVKKMSADAGILFFLRFAIIRTDDGEPGHGKYLCSKHAMHLHIVEAGLLDLLSLCR